MIMKMVTMMLTAAIKQTCQLRSGSPHPEEPLPMTVYRRRERTFYLKSKHNIIDQNSQTVMYVIKISDLCW